MKIDKIETLKLHRILYKMYLSQDERFPLRYIVSVQDEYYGLVELDDSDYIKTYGTHTELEVFFTADASCKWEKTDSSFFAPNHSQDNQSCVLVEKAELFNYLREITQ